MQTLQWHRAILDKGKQLASDWAGVVSQFLLSGLIGTVLANVLRVDKDVVEADESWLTMVRFRFILEVTEEVVDGECGISSISNGRSVMMAIDGK